MEKSRKGSPSSRPESASVSTPYLVEGLVLQILIGLGLAAVPFFIDL